MSGMRKTHLRYEESRVAICGAGQGQKTRQRVLSITFADVREDPAVLARVTCTLCDARASLYAYRWRK